MSFLIPTAPVHADSALRAQAYSIVLNSLLGSNIPSVTDSNGTHQYVMAGAHQYYTYWSRDFSWSVPGLIDVGKADAVHDTLELALGLQRSDGLIPRDIEPGDESIRYILGALGIRLPFKPPFNATYVDENNVITIDTNVIVPWAASEYVAKTQDKVFAQKWFSACEQAIAFLETGYYQDGLIANQPPFSDWEDSIARTGRVAYTNEIYILALRGMADWADFLGMADKVAYYTGKAADTQQKFFDYFWIPRRKIIRNFDNDERITLDANLMAVAYGLVPDDAAQQIMETLRGSILWNPIPGRATFPNFPDSMKSALPPLVGNDHYHDSQYWMWLTALASMAETAAGNPAGCNQVLDDLSQIIVKYNGMYEDYQEVNQNNQRTIAPVWTLLYHAEVPFTWSSGMFLHAYTLGCQ